MWSGWGIRTLARGQRAYNPLSYHNGTVWPHDNALIAWGAACYGYTEQACRALEGLFDAVKTFRHTRLPELFCGLERGAGEFPTHYPVACSPQAWSSAALFLLLRAVLGLHADAPGGRLLIRNPRLPAGLEDLRVEGLRLGGSRLDLHFRRTGEGTFAAVSRLDGPPLSVRIDLTASPEAVEPGA
jgi:glycogen debranching enzyme